MMKYLKPPMDVSKGSHRSETTMHQQKDLGIISEYIYYNALTYRQIYTSLIHSYISIYVNTLVEDNFRVGEGSSVLKALGGVPGSGKGCQGSKLCSILQVSERYVRLCNLAAVNRAGTALQTLEKFPGSSKDCQGYKLCSILEVFEKRLRLCSLAGKGQGPQPCRSWGCWKTPKIIIK